MNADTLARELYKDMDNLIYARIPYNNANYNGWTCPHCNARDFPEAKGGTKCWACGEVYQVAYVR